MIKRKIKFTHSIDFNEFELGEKNGLLNKHHLGSTSGTNDTITATPSDAIDCGLQGDAKVLYDAFIEFSKAGMTTDRIKELTQIDDVLKDASIQLTKDGGAVITDANGKSIKVRSGK